MNFKVSVIIPTYNAENVIVRTIKSIQKQTIGFENIELIIVDDNSNDSTKSILKEYESKYPNMKCILKDDNSGTPSRGRNIGIDNASSEYIMFIDQDDQYVEDMCETLYNAIKKYDVDIVMCDYKTINNNEFSSFGPKNQDDSSFIQCDPKDNETILLTNFMWNKIFKMEFIKKYDIKCPEGCFCEDPVFCIKAYLNTENVVFLNQYKGYLYNIGDDKDNPSASNSFNKDRFMRLFKGYEIVINMLKEANRQDLINEWMKFHFTNFISSFVRLDADYSDKIMILKDLTKFKKYANFNEKLNESWAEIISKNLDRGNYKFIIFYANIINKLYGLSTLRRVYRSVYNKFT